MKGKQIDLVVVRHGMERRGDLTDCGRIQMSELADQLEGQLRHGPIVVFTSDMRHTEQSAFALEASLARQGRDVHRWDECVRYDLWEALPELIGSAADLPDECTVACVGHQEWVSYEMIGYLAHVLDIPLPLIHPQHKTAYHASGWLLGQQRKPMRLRAMHPCG